MPDYEALRGETGGFPPDGIHDAYLDTARLVDTRSGESIVCDWRTTGDPLYQWTSWHRLGGQGLAFTLTFLDAIGVDRSALREVEGSRLEDALEARIGIVVRGPHDTVGIRRRRRRERRGRRSVQQRR